MAPAFIETGRSLPSREMLIRLSEELELPLRERNVLLLSAGFAPLYLERQLHDAALAAARRAIDVVLEAQKPFPAFVLDRHWNIVASNNALPEVYEGVAAEQWRAHLVSRLQRQVEVTADPQLAALLREVSAYPVDGAFDDADLAHEVLVPFQVRGPSGVLSFFSTTTVFGTPVDVTLAEPAIESFFPADQRTAQAVRK